MAAVARKPRYEEETAAEPYYAKSSPSLLAEMPAAPEPVKPPQPEQREWETLYTHCESRLQALSTWRLPWWETAGQIARYMKPSRYYAFIVANNYRQGLRQDQAIVDRKATLCGEICSAGLMAALTDPDREWAKFGPGIPGFELDQAGQQWYEDISERYNYVLTHCNFYDAQAQHYDDLTFFGTAVAIDYPSEETILQVRSPCSGEYMLGTGFDNSDEVMYEEFRNTVSQIVEGFGAENCPEEILAMWRRKGAALQNEFVVGHAIEPNFAIATGVSGDGVGVVSGGFTWREVYWLRGKKNAKPLSMAGFHERPFAASRWNTQGNEAYGRGIGEAMLGDAIQLQLITRQQAESAEKVNRPPMGADVSLQNLPSSTNPGKITYFNTGANGEKKFFPLYEIKPDIGALTAIINALHERLAETAYNDIFRMMENLRQQTQGQVTATEIDALKEEALMRMGPVIGRIYGTLRTRVKRHLAIMARRGLIPPKPQSLRGVPTKIDFISMLTAAQKATQTQAIARGAQFLGSLSGAWPTARFLLDVEKTGRDFFDGVGAPAGNLVSPQQFKKLVEQASKQEAASAAMAQTLPGAKAAQALSSTSLAPGSALSALVGNPQG